MLDDKGGIKSGMKQSSTEGDVADIEEQGRKTRHTSEKLKHILIARSLVIWIYGRIYGRNKRSESKNFRYAIHG